MTDSPPKYALPEFERRWRVEASALPPLDPATGRLIEDRYIDGGRLRLRRMTGGTETIHKLCKKYGGATPGEPIVNIYLSPDEYAALRALPGRDLVKRRFLVAHDSVRFAIDRFERPHAGLMLCEVETGSAAALALVVPPAWAGVEVTDDPAFSGASLARNH